MRCFFILLLVLSVQVGFGQAGQLDATFGEHGVTTTVIGKSASDPYKILTQSDGKILVGGNFYLDNKKILYIIRYNGDGSLDRTFGDEGKVEYLNGNSSTETRQAMALQPDGKILLSTTALSEDSNWAFILYRFDTDGTIDRDFGQDGHAITDAYGYENIPTNIGILPNGDILQCGYMLHSRYIGLIVKYKSSGIIDSTFGNNGIDTNMISNFSSNMEILPSGKILISNGDELPACYNPDMSPDTSFHQPTYNELPFVWTLNAISIQSTGNIISAGYQYSANNEEIPTIIRESENGWIDTTFKYDATAVRNLFPNSQFVSVAIENDDKILALIPENKYPYTMGGVFRFLPDGEIDSSFGHNGVYIIDTDMIILTSYRSITIQPDGKILLLGSSNGYIHPYTYGEPYICVIRLLADSIGKTINANTGLSVYPNPATGQATLTYTVTKNENISIGLYDLQGRKMQDIIHDDYTIQGSYSQAINTGGLSPGSYIVRIDNGKENTGVKVTVK